MRFCQRKSAAEKGAVQKHLARLRELGLFDSYEIRHKTRNNYTIGRRIVRRQKWNDILESDPYYSENPLPVARGR